MTNQANAINTTAVQLSELLKDAIVKQNAEFGWLEQWLENHEDEIAKQFSGEIKRGFADLRSRRATLILRLANMPPEAGPVQRLVSSFEPRWHEWAPAMKRTLELLWPRETHVLKKQALIDTLMQLAGKDVRAVVPLGRMELPTNNLPGQIVLAILENWPRMAKCGNPNCPAPYFLAKRTTQRYCESGECTKYAQRAKALRYWHKKTKSKEEEK